MKQLTKLFHQLLLLFFLIQGVACEPEPLEIDIPQAEQKMVVYSQTLPDQALVVTLSKSYSALVTPNEPSDSNAVDSVNNVFLNQFLVENATVIVSGVDFNDTLPQVVKGVYVAPFFPFSPGNSYQLTAHDPTTGFSISSTTTTLPIVDFKTLLRG